MLGLRSSDGDGVALACRGEQGVVLRFGGRRRQVRRLIRRRCGGGNGDVPGDEALGDRAQLHDDGARLLTGSYYGQTVQIWSALMTAAILAGVMVGLVGLVERLVARTMGAQP